MKNDNLKMGDFLKPIKNHWEGEFKRDFFYVYLPLVIVSCLVVAAGIVGVLKLVDLKIID